MYTFPRMEQYKTKIGVNTQLKKNWKIPKNRKTHTWMKTMYSVTTWEIKTEQFYSWMKYNYGIDTFY